MKNAMKTFNFTCYALLMAVIVILGTSCSKVKDSKDEDSKGKLVGTWEEKRVNGKEWVWVFRADGTCDLIYEEPGHINKDLDNYSYAIDGEQVIVKGYEEGLNYTIILKIISLTDTQLKCSWRSPQWGDDEEDVYGTFVRIK